MAVGSSLANRTAWQACWMTRGLKSNDCNPGCGVRYQLFAVFVEQRKNVHATRRTEASGDAARTADRRKGKEPVRWGRSANKPSYQQTTQCSKSSDYEQWTKPSCWWAADHFDLSCLTKRGRIELQPGRPTEAARGNDGSQPHFRTVQSSFNIWMMIGNGCNFSLCTAIVNSYTVDKLLISIQ